MSTCWSVRWQFKSSYWQNERYRTRRGRPRSLSSPSGQITILALINFNYHARQSTWSSGTDRHSPNLWYLDGTHETITPAPGTTRTDEVASAAAVPRVKCGTRGLTCRYWPTGRVLAVRFLKSVIITAAAFAFPCGHSSTLHFGPGGTAVLIGGILAMGHPEGRSRSTIDREIDRFGCQNRYRSDWIVSKLQVGGATKGTANYANISAQTTSWLIVDTTVITNKNQVDSLILTVRQIFCGFRF